MDKPTTPGGLSGSKSSWPEDSGSEEDFGATGVFGTIKPPEQSAELGNSKPEPDLLANLFAEPPQPRQAPQPPPAAPKPVAEPMVHKVVLGGGAAANQTQLLDRIRMASAERAPATQSGGHGSGGFTELLRTLGNESPASVTKEIPRPKMPQSETPRPETPRPAADSGFTSLLQTLGTSQAAPAPVASSSPRPAEPIAGSSPAQPSPGGITEMLRVAPMPDSGIESRQVTASGSAAFTPPVTNPAVSKPAVISPTATNPGSFTELFGTFESAGSTPTAAPANRETAVSSAGSAGSFTRMLSLEQQSAPAAHAYREEPRPTAGGLDYSLPPAAPKPAEASRDPFAPAPMPHTSPPQSTLPGSGVGITRLIQMLDEPAKPYTPPVESAPLSPPHAAEPGIWTQTFASLSTPTEPAAPAPREPDWSVPPPVPATPAYPVSQQPQYGSIANPPVANQPPAPSASSGPSEFTRILDASRMREMAMRTGAGADTFSPPPPPQSAAPIPQFAAPAPPPMPGYPVAPPAPPPMQGFRAMPQPGGFPPPQPPAYPMQYGQQAGSMPPMGAGSQPQPGMYVPAAPPMPAAPQVPPVKLPEPGAQKLQVYLLIMGGVIIVLLIIILVTVIFLMKH